MSLVSFTTFSGLAPRLSPYKLPQSNAQVAKNLCLSARTLKPWNDPLTVLSGVSAAPVTTIYRFGQDLISDSQYWFAWPVDVDVVKGAISGDATERTFFTHPTLGPRYTNNTLALTSGSGAYPWNSRPLGVPAPTATPTITAGSGTEVPEARVVVFTYVTDDGQEGPPSPPSTAADVYPDGTCTYGNLGTTAPAGYSHITAKRVYRTLSGSTNTDFQFVDEIPIAQASYTDTKTAVQLGGVIESLAYDPPPAGAFGITQMANGITVVFDGYDIYPSEPFLPHAFPSESTLSTDYPIVAGKAFGNVAVIGTTGVPYLLFGSDPSALTLQKLQDPQACVSKRSMCVVPGGVMYASPDGLILVDASGAVTNVLDQLMTRREWQAFVPSSIHGYVHDGRYIGFYNTGAATGGFIYDPREGDAAFTLIDLYATGGYTDLVQDALYLQVGTNIQRWDAGAGLMSYDWKSRVIEFPYPMMMAFGQVTAAGYPVTVKVYADGTLLTTKTVSSKAPFALPAKRARTFEAEVTGTTEVMSMNFAQSVEELKAVA